MKLHPDGQVKAISVNGHWYEVAYLIYSLQSMIGQGITIWLVICNGKYYMLKDSWIQTSRVGSEIEFLKKLKGDPKLQGHVPHIVEGEDIYIGGFVDSTRWYHTYVGGLHDACSHRRLVMTPIGKQSLLSSRLLNSSMHSLTSLENADILNLGYLKLSHVVDAECAILSNFPPFWNPFKPFIRDLLAVFFPIHPILGSHITPQKMINILEDAAEHMDAHTVDPSVLAPDPGDSDILHTTAALLLYMYGLDLALHAWDGCVIKMQAGELHPLSRSSSKESRHIGLSTGSSHAGSYASQLLLPHHTPQTSDPAFLEQEIDDLCQLNSNLEEKYKILEAQHKTLQSVSPLPSDLSYCS
ncbi:hypothetical protein L208DRAFT_1544922 [Tricholoma matsutake]|nr:hypothetical protein L208DRAFT_1544922 [Tricholoma matsutake 945]